MNMRFFKIAVCSVVISVIAFLTACNSINQMVPNAAQSGSDFFTDEKVLQDFTSELKKTVGSDNPNILQILIYNDYAMVQIQDPKKPENVDGYTFRDGKLSSPQPVKLMGGGDLKDNIFPLNEVDLSKISALSKQINEKLKDVEGGKIIGYNIERNLPFNEDVQINILTQATRKSVTAHADTKGNITKFEVK